MEKNTQHQAISQENNQAVSVEPNWMRRVWYRNPYLDTVADANAALVTSGWSERYLDVDWSHVDQSLNANISRFIIEQYLTPRITPPLGLLIMGGVGVGKTSIMALIARRLCRYFSNGMNYIHCGVLFDMYYERQFEKVNRLMEGTFLFLDDLGTGYPSEFPLAKLESFIEYRYAHMLPTFVTTNMKIEDLKQRPDYLRIADRLNDPAWLRLLIYAGESRRKR